MNSTPKLTIGKAIDQIIDALSSLDKKEQMTVINTVCSHLEFDKIPARAQPDIMPPAQTTSPASSPDQGSAARARSIDIRSLRETKQPDSARQMACLVAYYLQELAPQEEQKQTITTSDLERYFKQANFKLPTKLEQLLIDSKNAGYFDVVSRGEYKLTRVGYNLVAHSMPKSAKGG
ncbi:hypothetical protein [Ralstonia chuxiongensis]|uniref:Uncharacterized protein n=1 Tax=Ralstonia chuxiongensis TaxID=2957504 RepID=A0AA41WLX4_9RALS|nr:hypothetical protein [Ralstonia chuxiongensis]MCP1171520.1 hypothetical protein [Ralstonia chuxiongensis]